MLMTETGKPKNWWQRLDGPLKVGLVFAILGIILTIVGILRDPTTPVTACSLGVGSLISGLTWGLVSWAIATAAVEDEVQLVFVLMARAEIPGVEDEHLAVGAPAVAHHAIAGVREVVRAFGRRSPLLARGRDPAEIGPAEHLGDHRGTLGTRPVQFGHQLVGIHHQQAGFP